MLYQLKWRLLTKDKVNVILKCLVLTAVVSYLQRDINVLGIDSSCFNDEWYHFDLGFLREILVNNLQMLALGFRVIVHNATFNNISAISWRPVLLVEETRVLGENHRPTSSH
jgi:hypothetical protein